MANGESFTYVRRGGLTYPGTGIDVWYLSGATLLFQNVFAGPYYSVPVYVGHVVTMLDTPRSGVRIVVNTDPPGRVRSWYPEEDVAYIVVCPD